MNGTMEELQFFINLSIVGRPHLLIGLRLTHMVPLLACPLPLVQVASFAMPEVSPKGHLS